MKRHSNVDDDRFRRGVLQSVSARGGEPKSQLRLATAKRPVAGASPQSGLGTDGCEQRFGCVACGGDAASELVRAGGEHLDAAVLLGILSKTSNSCTPDARVPPDDEGFCIANL